VKEPLQNLLSFAVKLRTLNGLRVGPAGQAAPVVTGWEWLGGAQVLKGRRTESEDSSSKRSAQRYKQVLVPVKCQGMCTRR
jgi:hypothetical protein